MAKKSVKNDCILVRFFGPIDPLELSTKETQVTYEHVIKECIQHIKDRILAQKFIINGPMFYPTFGLVSYPEEKESLWLPPCYVFEKRSVKPRVYVFRVRHRPFANRLGDYNLMSEYLFQQVRQDFLDGLLDKTQLIEEENFFRCVAMALFIPKTLPPDNTQVVDEKFQECKGIWKIFFNKTISKTVWKRLCNNSVYLRVWVPQSLSKEMDNFKKSSKKTVWNFKQYFYSLLMNSVPNYCFEEYSVTFVERAEKTAVVTAKLGMVDEFGREPSLYFGKEFRCSIKDIETLRLTCPRDLNAPLWQVLINLKSESPLILQFKDEGAAESFVSMVQGYYKLYVRYDTCLNLNLRTARVKMSEELKSFGPLLPDTAKDYALKHKGVNSSLAYLIHESVDKFGDYVVVGKTEEDGLQTLVRVHIEHRTDDSGQHFHLLEPEGECSFNTIRELKRYLTKYGQQIPPRCYSVVADINTVYRKSWIDDYEPSPEHDLFETTLPNGPAIYLRTDFHDKKKIKDKNPMISKFEVYMPDGGPAMLVELLTNEWSINMSYLEGLKKLLQLGKIDQTRFLKFYGLLLESKICALMEYSPHSDLLTYICTNVLRISQKVNIMYQIIKILGILEQQQLYHGNLRLRKFLVFDTSSGEKSVTIKLGDPGVSYYFDTLPVDNQHNVERLPWLSPERRKDLVKVTYDSECYALGTMICEILYRNDQFHEELKMDNPQALADYLCEHNHLPPPIFLSQSQEGTSATGNDLLPEAREVLMSMWENIVMPCWAEDAAERPSPEKLLQDTEDIQVKASQITTENQWERTRQIAYDWGIYDPELKKKHDQKKPTIKELHEEMRIRSKGQFLPPESIKLNGKKLGQGHFGVVCEGFIKPEGAENEVRVAVKMLKSEKGVQLTEEEQAQFIQEIQRAIALNHDNIVKVLHVSENKNSSASNMHHLLLIMEYMDQGTLSKYAQEEKNQKNVPEMLGICLDVVAAMVYLSSKEIVHRDLACRNVLLCLKNRKLVAKVSDFGLARNMERNYRFYDIKQLYERPFASWPPECLKGYKHQINPFTTKSDVWSFGTFLWEAFSHGQSPNKSLPSNVIAAMCSDVHVSEYLSLLCDAYEAGWRFKKESYVNEEIYKVMELCWQMDPVNRPYFADLQQKLGSLLNSISI